MLSIPYNNFSGSFSGSFFIGVKTNYSINTPAVPNFKMDVISLIRFIIKNINNKNVLRETLYDMNEYIDNSDEPNTVLISVRNILTSYLNGDQTKSETLTALHNLLGDSPIIDENCQETRCDVCCRRRCRCKRKCSQNLPTSVKYLDLPASSWPDPTTNFSSNIDISVPPIIPSTGVSTTTNTGLFIKNPNQTNTNQSLYSLFFSNMNSNQIVKDQQLLGQLVTDGTLIEQGQIQQQILDATSINNQTTSRGGVNPIINGSRFPILIPSIASLSAGLPIPLPNDTDIYVTYKQNIQDAQSMYVTDVQIYNQPIAVSTYYNNVQYYVLQYWINIYTTAGNVLTSDQQQAYTTYITARTTSQNTFENNIKTGINKYVARSKYNVEVNKAFQDCIPYFQNIDFRSISIYPIFTFTPLIFGKYIRTTFSSSLNNINAQSASFEIDATKIAPLLCNAYRRLLKYSILNQNLVVKKTRISNILTTGPSPHQLWTTILTWVYSYSSLAVYSWTYDTLGFPFPTHEKKHRTLNFIFEECYLRNIDNILSKATIPDELSNWVGIAIPANWIQLIYGDNYVVDDSDSDSDTGSEY